MRDSFRVLVTGATGFIGSATVRAFLAAGAHVRALVEPGVAPNALPAHPRSATAVGDLRDQAALDRAAAGCTAVVHLAALARDWGPLAPFLSVNVGGTANLLLAARRAKVERFVFVSSVAVHAYRDYARADEDTPRDGHALPYGLSKILGEDLVRAAHAAGDVAGVIVRPGVVPYGPGDRAALLPLLAAIRRGVPLLVGGGRARFSTIYVDDLAQGFVLAATHPAAAGRTYLMADRDPVSWHDYFGALAAVLGHRLNPLSLPAALVRPAAVLADAAFARHWPTTPPPLTRYRAELLTHDLVFTSDRAARELGFAPHTRLPEGVARAVAWAQSL